MEVNKKKFQLSEGEIIVLEQLMITKNVEKIKARQIVKGITSMEEYIKVCNRYKTSKNIFKISNIFNML